MSKDVYICGRMNMKKTMKVTETRTRQTGERKRQITLECKLMYEKSCIWTSEKDMNNVSIMSL